MKTLVAISLLVIVCILALFRNFDLISRLFEPENGYSIGDCLWISSAIIGLLGLVYFLFIITLAKKRDEFDYAICLTSIAALFSSLVTLLVYKSRIVTVFSNTEIMICVTALIVLVSGLFLIIPYVDKDQESGLNTKRVLLTFALQCFVTVYFIPRIPVS